MSRVVIVATAGAGGDLQPLVAAGLDLRDRGHETLFVGDRTVQASLLPLGIEVKALAPELDLGPRLVPSGRPWPRQVVMPSPQGRSYASA